MAGVADERNACCRCTTEVAFYDTSSRLGYLAQTNLFKAIGIVVTAFYLVWVAVDTDSNDASSLSESAMIFQVVGCAFLVFFLTEASVRAMAFRDKRQIFCCGALIWDIILAAALISPWLVEGSADALQLSRVARLFKAVPWRRGLKEDTTLSVLIVHVGFSFMLLFLCLLYVTAIVMTQIARDTAVGQKYFPSVSETMMNIMLHGADAAKAGTAQVLFIYIVFIVGVLVAAGFSITAIVMKMRARKSEARKYLINAPKAQDGASEDEILNA